MTIVVRCLCFYTTGYEKWTYGIKKLVCNLKFEIKFHYSHQEGQVLKSGDEFHQVRDFVVDGHGIEVHFLVE